MDINYLVFSGGGAAGYAHGGAISQLGKEPDFSFEKIKGVAGVSIGSLAALMVSLNFTSDEISEKLSTFDLKKIQDGGSFPKKVHRFFTEYGLYAGDVLYQLIKDLIKQKTGRDDPENVTFADLKEKGYKDLYIVATKMYKENNTPTGKEKVFSFDKTPKTSVAAAILASTASPVYFRRVRLKKIEKGKYVLDKEGDLFDDGGIVNNFPINIFDKPKYLSRQEDTSDLEVNPHTLGLVLLNADKIQDQNHQIIKTPINDNHPLEYAVGIVNTLLLKFQRNNLEKRENRERAIQIDRLGVASGDFNIDEKTKKALIESGKLAVRAYFAAQCNDVTFACKKVEIENARSKPSIFQDSIFQAKTESKIENKDNQCQKRCRPCVII